MPFDLLKCGFQRQIQALATATTLLRFFPEERVARRSDDRRFDCYWT